MERKLSDGHDERGKVSIQAGYSRDAQFDPPDAQLQSFVTQAAGAAPVSWEPVGNPRGSGTTWRVELAGRRFVLLKTAPDGVDAWPEPALQQALSQLGTPVLPLIAVSADRRAMLLPWVPWPTCAGKSPSSASA